jgi:hypothetical protein
MRKCTTVTKTSSLIGFSCWRQGKTTKKLKNSGKMSYMYVRVTDQNCFVNKYQKVIFYISIHLDYLSVLIIQHLYK